MAVPLAVDDMNVERSRSIGRENEPLTIWRPIRIAVNPPSERQ
jgi:hypothetical protein